MISNAKDSPLFSGAGNLPNVQGALADWFQKLTFVKMKKEIVNFSVAETPVPYSFMGVRQPMSPRQLMIKPEGERSWDWQTIHAYPDLILENDDRIFFGGVPYRVMNKSDWKEYGYVEYQIVRDYNDPA